MRAKPEIHLIMACEKAESASNALSDFLCWIDGFIAADGDYAPKSQEALRELKWSLDELITKANDAE